MDRHELQAVPVLMKDETVEQPPACEACSRSKSGSRQAESSASCTGMAALPTQVCTQPAVCDVKLLLISIL